MSTIAVVGGTGYTGTNVAKEARARGHDVVSFSRSAPQEPVPGVSYEHGTSAEAVRVVPGTDVVVAALSPRGATAGTLRETYAALADAAVEAGSRLIVVGGFSSLRPAPGEPRFAEGEVPEEYRAEALEGESVRQWLESSAPDALAWTFVSPAGAYGAWAPGERTGRYRLGGDVALFDDAGNSEISGADLAVAIVDEVENAAHVREHVGVAY